MDQQKYPVCLPSDTDGLMRVLRRVKKWRDRADREDPAKLQSLQLARRIDGLCRPLFTDSTDNDPPSVSACAPAQCSHFRWPPHRTPPIPRNVDLAGRTVKIESALQSSISKHCSQVYVATVDDSPMTVILKVYQSSLHKDLDDLNENMETAY
ncbi:hypothetical protein EXIGLDRAFT_753359 [Exidia glandulosa HHB12029]|uniref:Uncharacterized protein n=1 Tax=Exidia glandulosa HHB12029 TaxID=1314781 RepID=A0A165DTY4_EXIGL|nr:hypothetical protein EXIGLDRAFT_753359 [Exidia glandulosa HHB12029]